MLEMLVSNTPNFTCIVLLFLNETLAIFKPFTSVHWYLYSSHFFLCISYGNDKENLCGNQKLLELEIIFFIFIIFIC